MSRTGREQRLDTEQKATACPIRRITAATLYSPPSPQDSGNVPRPANKRHQCASTNAIIDFRLLSGIQSNILSTELHRRNTNVPIVQCKIATPKTHVHECVVVSTHPVSELPYAPGRVDIVLLRPHTMPASPGAMSIMFACIDRHYITQHSVSSIQ